MELDQLHFYSQKCEKVAGNSDYGLNNKEFQIYIKNDFYKPATLSRPNRTGALILANNKIFTGNNGIINQIDDTYHIDDRIRLRNLINNKRIYRHMLPHAEERAITKAISENTDLSNSVLFVNRPCCITCAKKIIKAKIPEIYICMTTKNFTLTISKHGSDWKIFDSLKSLNNHDSKVYLIDTNTSNIIKLDNNSLSNLF
ncbi:MAG: hypothetical protein HRU36_00870 [Rickettsiales bacterium]|nr:hypothetical protein [Rickettsiales bacterium]